MAAITPTSQAPPEVLQAVSKASDCMEQLRKVSATGFDMSDQEWDDFFIHHPEYAHRLRHVNEAMVVATQALQDLLFKNGV